MPFARILVVTFTFTLLCPAQRPDPTGAVTGRVLCADTNLPARMAHVVLQPVIDNTSVAKSPTSPDHPREPATIITETLLDGSFTIPNVKPGNYYVIVEKPGYLSPLSQLSRDDLNHPTPQTTDLIARLLTPVSVVANRTSTVEVRILKGAALSGTIRYDDGTPDASAGVSLLTKDKSGKWTPFRTSHIGLFGSSTTDDQGHYRISGLPAGEYLVQTTLEISDTTVDRVFGGSSFMIANARYSLDIYFGDVIRQRDAKPIKLAEGEESSSADLTIPVSQLHSVTGSVTDLATGRTVNAGKVIIAYADDDTQLVSTDISKDDNAFHFYYVPEGEYTIKVTDAREVTREEVPFSPGVMPPTYTTEKKIRDYTVQPQPIIIHGDMTGLTLQAIPKPTAK